MQIKSHACVLTLKGSCMDSTSLREKTLMHSQDNRKVLDNQEIRPCLLHLEDIGEDKINVGLALFTNNVYNQLC